MITNWRGIGLDHKNWYWVIVYDNDKNTFEEVIQVIQKATSCSYEVAEHVAWEIHNKGQSKVMIAPFVEARKASKLISNIGIKVIVTKTK
ncbi:MAG: hypothetical protein IEMM0008_0922 [bacterium]|nr:MAG: hypothetical protein IEMM0008_0922 [bacterium]